jgi:hypothetical protein
MIPNNPEAIKKLKELADRNIANGDWGDEITVPGLPGETVIPMTPEERIAKRFVVKHGGLRLPKKRRDE